ncbi:hypothetical protein [Cryptosporangium aurantiacum]|uniref:Uncharacterized protein n=1 Tax=Cryptosporangium aurantiacum TaxID=134849 RepID=A0A1M7REK0_9ACTN|nr:hypothetical protein [Cryptosporangium aurantiacum]SHN44646.1 hypothetical protein SAMN05443668_110302 [Cryptosporangium aurantiacum]
MNETVWSVCALFAALVVAPVVANLISVEIQGWLDRLPPVLIRLAARRLPQEIRADHIDEWDAELSAILEGSAAGPLSRLALGLTYTSGLLRGAPKVARELGRARRRRLAAVFKRIRVHSLTTFLVVLVTTVVLAGQFGDGIDPFSAAITVTCAGMGVLILIAVQRHPVGRLLLAAGISGSVAAVATSWPQWIVLAWLSQWAWWPMCGLILLGLLVFPNGRLPSRRWRWLAALLVVTTAAGAVVLAVAALDYPRTLLQDTQPVGESTRLLLRAFAVIVLATVLGLAATLAALWRRWRRGDSDTRQQLACLLPTVILLLLGWMLEIFNLDGGYLLALIALPLGMSVAIIRHGLYDLDKVLNRTLVWLTMTTLVVIGFVGIVIALRELVMRNLSADTVSLVTTGFIALAYAPLHRRVQQGVNQLLYGDRHDPYEVTTKTR